MRIPRRSHPRMPLHRHADLPVPRQDLRPPARAHRSPRRSLHRALSGIADQSRRRLFRPDEGAGPCRPRTPVQSRLHYRRNPLQPDPQNLPPGRLRRTHPGVGRPPHGLLRPRPRPCPQSRPHHRRPRPKRPVNCRVAPSPECTYRPRVFRICKAIGCSIPRRSALACSDQRTRLAIPGPYGSRLIFSQSSGESPNSASTSSCGTGVLCFSHSSATATA